MFRMTIEDVFAICGVLFKKLERSELDRGDVLSAGVTIY
jgi:hypothetical protein